MDCTVLHSYLLCDIICSIVVNSAYPSKRVLSISPFVRRRTGCHQGRCEVRNFCFGKRNPIIKQAPDRGREPAFVINYVFFTLL